MKWCYVWGISRQDLSHVSLTIFIWSGQITAWVDNWVSWISEPRHKFSFKKRLVLVLDSDWLCCVFSLCKIPPKTHSWRHYISIQHSVKPVLGIRIYWFLFMDTNFPPFGVSQHNLFSCSSAWTQIKKLQFVTNVTHSVRPCWSITAPQILRLCCLANRICFCFWGTTMFWQINNICY